MTKILKIILIVLVAGFILIQLVPYGRDHNNPSVIAEPDWDSPRTRELFMTVCGDCHSNETVWPWYSNIAPVSWLVQHDTEEGRQKLNISEWGVRQYESGEAAETYAEGEMPLKVYFPTHPEARLAAAERQELLDGLIATFGKGQ